MSVFNKDGKDKNVFLPQTNILPRVYSLKCFSSLGKRQGSLLFLPIASLEEAATIRVIIGCI